MSTTTPDTSPPDPVTAPVPLGAGPPVETAPSAMLEEGPAFARGIAIAGMFLLVLGAAAVIAKRVIGTDRIVPEGMGFMLAALGLALLLYHATVDRTTEVRRFYGLAAIFWFIVAVAFSVYPGPVGVAGATKAAGYFLLPWGVGFGLLSLLFALPFVRHETDEKLRVPMVTGLFVLGVLLVAGSAVAGIFRPDFLAGPGVALGLLGLGFLCAYLGQVDTSDGVGYWVAFALGAFGAALVVYAIGRAVFPTILYEGPRPLRRANGELDWWKATFRVLAGVLFLVPALIASATRAPLWLKAVLGLIGVVGAGVVVTSLVTNPVQVPPAPFLVPGGLILMVLGGTYLLVGLGICSDNPFITMTRRELAAYFLSPIGYLVLAGMALIQWIGYYFFVSRLIQFGQVQQPLQEPIVGQYYNLLMLFALMFQVPMLTMRLVSEEKRTGSLEVLMTAPVNEWPVILSKFLATWIFFLITWLAAGLYLIALRMEVRVPFDYRPLLSFYVCLMAQGLAFVGMGLFFSTLTKNQIVAAVMTFVGMMFYLLCYILREQPTAFGLPPFLQTALGRLSFYHMWEEALSGRLPLRDVLLFSSLGAFWLFLSVKVLEARKWS